MKQLLFLATLFCFFSCKKSDPQPLLEVTVLGTWNVDEFYEEYFEQGVFSGTATIEIVELTFNADGTGESVLSNGGTSSFTWYADQYSEITIDFEGTQTIDTTYRVVTNEDNRQQWEAFYPSSSGIFEIEATVVLSR